MSGPGRQQEWAYYPLYLFKRSGACVVNLKALEADATPQPIRLLLICHIEPSDENIFGSTAERNEFDSLIDTFRNALRTTCRGTWCGQLREPGTLTACFYCPTAPSQETLRSLEKPLIDAGKQFQIDIAEDPDWQFYFDELMPPPLAEEWIRNESVEASLRSNGDPITTPREIDHFAYFPTKAAARAFAERVRADGFAPDEPAHLKEQRRSHRGLSWTVLFKRLDLPSADEITPITLSLQASAQEFEGQYDGWGTIALDS